MSPFFLGGLVPVVAGLLLVRTLPPAIVDTVPGGVPLPIDWGRHFLAYGSAWFQGFLEGGMLAFLALYLESIGVSAAGTGRLMGITMLGVLVFQVPVAWIADRIGRMPAILGCYAVVAIGLALMPVLAPSTGLAVCLFFLGACSGALYPLALAFLGDQLPQARMARAYAWFLAMECVGSQLGAASMGEARDRWGEGSMFAVGLAALVLVLGAWTIVSIWNRCRRAPHERKDDERRTASE
jgi:MFS family permease